MDGTRSALIVASYDYQDPGLRRLRAPARDAEALARVLRDPNIGDFDVRTMLNEPAYVVNEAVEDFFDDRGTDDLLLLHFSCHGVKDEGGELYFATANTKLRRLGATAVAAEFVNRRMSRSRSRRVVLLLDCCYAGAFERGIVARAGAGVDIEEQFGGRGRAVITASSAMEYAFEGDQLADSQELQPSVFTSALVEGLETGEADRDQDGYIALDELYDYVYDKVRSVTPNQTPGKWTFAVQGELYIARRSRPVTTPAPLPPELQQVIEHPIPVIRAGAVQALERLLGSRHAGLALAARLALEDLVDDDSRTVSAAATAALASSPEPAATPSEHPQPDATEPAASPLSVPPQPPEAISPPMSAGSTTTPETPSATTEDRRGSIPGSAATPAPTSTPPQPVEPTWTNADDTSRRDAPLARASPMQAPDRTTTGGTSAPDLGERKPPAVRAGMPPATAGKPYPPQPPRTRPRRPASPTRIITIASVAAAFLLIPVVIGIINGAWNPDTTGTTSPPTTSAPSPTSAPTTSGATPPSTGTVIFRDNFSDPGSGWPDDVPGRNGGHYVTGAYRLHGGPKLGWASWPGDAKVSPDAGPRVRVDVKARAVAGSDQGTYGIACRVDNTHGYLLEVGENGRVLIQKYIDSSSKLTELADLETTVIKTHATNSLQATCTSTTGQKSVHLMLWANGQLVAQATDKDHPLGSGTVGLSVTPFEPATKPIEAQFDDFVVMNL